MNTLVVLVDGERREVSIGDPTHMTLDEVNAALDEAGVGHLVRAVPPPTPEEQRAAEQRHRDSLLAEVRSYPEAERRKALADINRKGWGLDGLSTDNLKRLASMLRPDWDDDD